MKLFRITTDYPWYLDQFYVRNSKLADASFEQQYAALVQDCFGWSDFWSDALLPLGYQVWEPVANAVQLQQTWARENSVNFSDPGWMKEILAAQIRQFRPDVVFADDPGNFDADFLRRVREQCDSIRLIVGWCGAPPTHGSVFSAYDLVLSNIPSFVTEFRRRGLDAEHFRHAFSPNVLQRIQSNEHATAGFCFVGSLNRGAGFHGSRMQLLLELLRNTDLELFVPGSISRDSTVRETLNQAIRSVAYVSSRTPGLRSVIGAIPRAKQAVSGYQNRRDEALLAKRSRPALFGRAMFEKLAESSVTLNTHIDAAGDSASNMRLFEATGVGACLLTDWKSDLAQIFEPEREVVTYRSAAEAIEKYRWLVENPAQRDAIAKAGQARTLRDHTFAQRAPILDELVRSRL